MTRANVYKVSYWSIWMSDPDWKEKHFYVCMTPFNFEGFCEFLRLNWPAYDFVYEEIII